MSQDQFEKVYVSYNWATEEEQPVVENLKVWCKEQEVSFQVITEKEELKYKDHIDEFMQTIAENWCVIAVISERYMRSLYCMTELLKTHEEGGLDQRLLPIKVNDYWPSGDEQIKLIDYWNKEVEKVEGRETEEAKGVREISENLETLLDKLRINGKPHSTKDSATTEDNATFKEIVEYIQRYQQEKTLFYQRQERFKKNFDYSKNELENEFECFLLKEAFVKELDVYWIESKDSGHKLMDKISQIDPVTVLSVFWQVVVKWSRQNTDKTPEEKISVHRSVNGILGWLVYFAMDIDSLKLLPIEVNNNEVSYISVPLIDELGVEIYMALNFGFRAGFLGESPYIRGANNAQNYQEKTNNGWGEDVSHGVARAAWKGTFNDSYKGGKLSSKDLKLLNSKLSWKKKWDKRGVMYCTATKGDNSDPLSNPTVYKEILADDFLPDMVLIIKDNENKNSLFKQDELDLLQPIQELVSIISSENSKKEEII